MLLYRWPKKAMLFILFLLLIIGSSKFSKFRFTDVISRIYMQFSLSMSTPVAEQIQLSSSPVALAPIFSHLYSCPVCFGYGMCDEVMKSSVLFHGELSMPHNNRIVWKKGVLHTRRVLISSLIAEEWNQFDEFICRNASHSVPCDLSTAIWKTVLAIDNLLSPETFKNLNSLLDMPFSQLALPVCCSQKLLKEIKKSFDDNFDGHFSREEKIQLLTSLIMQPGYVVMKLQALTRMTMPIPNLLGACGRSVILEGGLKPLKYFLKESFDTRAGLAIQVLQLVEDFEEEDPQWYFLFLGFSLDGIVVTNEGEVVVIDLDNLVILDKATFLPESSNVVNAELCNEVCFQKITLEMFYGSSNASTCNHISKYSQLMYAIVCKEVLSYLDDHKSEGFFNFDGHRIHRKQKHPGLLHKIPLEIEDTVENLIRECVQETKPNGRLKAVTELRDILENYINTDNFGIPNSKKELQISRKP